MSLSKRSVIGAYGAWAAALAGPDPQPPSFRHPDWPDMDRWRATARARVLACMAPPESGPRTEATLLKPAGATDHYRCEFFPGPHKFDLAMQAVAFEWFDHWL